MTGRRHYPASSTQEDNDAWNHYMRRRRLRSKVYDVLPLYVYVKEADRRDADLMWNAQRIASFGPCGIELCGIACRGWDQAEDGRLRTL